MDARSQSPHSRIPESLFRSTHIHRRHSRRSCGIRNAGRAEEEPWASMRGGLQRIAKSITETQGTHNGLSRPCQISVEDCMSTTGPWRAVRDSQQLRAMKKGGLCRRRRPCESGIFSTSVAKTPPLAPATPTKRQMRREKTRMLDARPRVRQEHEKAASRHCLPRRPPGSASRISSGEGEGAQRTPTSLRGSLVHSHHYQQSRFGWHRGNGLALPATRR